MFYKQTSPRLASARKRKRKEEKRREEKLLLLLLLFTAIRMTQFNGANDAAKASR